MSDFDQGQAMADEADARLRKRAKTIKQERIRRVNAHKPLQLEACEVDFQSEERDPLESA